MAERLSPDEIKARIPAITRAMKGHTFRHICAVYGVFDEQFGELIGSGTVINLWGEAFVLTAHHVAQEKLSPELDGTGRKYQGIAHSLRSGVPPRMISTPCYGMPRPYDLCLIQIDDSDMDQEAVKLEQLAATSSLADRDMLFIQGFPGARSRALFGVNSETLPFLTGPGIATCDWFDPRIHFAIDYPATGLVDELGNSSDLVVPGGLSGAPVWATGRSNTGDNWDPSVARIIGVIHSWEQRDQILIGTRIEAVKGFLLQVLRSRYAYENWERRGRPSLDDWTDWFSSMEAIPNLSGERRA